MKKKKEIKYINYSKRAKKIIKYAQNYYNRIFNSNYKSKCLSKEEIENLLKDYPKSTMVEWHYCCYGLYQNCWQELIEEGNWGLTQEQVNKDILDIFTPEFYKKYRDEHRMFVDDTNRDRLKMLIVARDLNIKMDYLITFNK